MNLNALPSSHKASFLCTSQSYRNMQDTHLSLTSQKKKQQKQNKTPQHYSVSHYQESARNHFHRTPCTDFSPSAGNLKVDRTQSHTDRTQVRVHPSVSLCSVTQFNLRLLRLSKPWFLHVEYTDNKGTYLVTFLWGLKWEVINLKTINRVSICHRHLIIVKAFPFCMHLECHWLTAC